MSGRILFTFTSTALPEKCPTCEHVLAGHLYIADDFSSFSMRDEKTVLVPFGGIVVCPDMPCDCKSTWSLRLPSVVGSIVAKIEVAEGD